MNNYIQHLEEIKQLYAEIGTKKGAGREIWKRYFPDSSQHSVIKSIEKILKRREASGEIETHTKVYSEVLSPNKIPLDQVGVYWDKSNPDYSVLVKPNKFDLDDLDEVLNFDFSNVEQIQHSPIPKMAYDFDMAVWTDVHVGMETNPDGVAMYATEWNEQVLLERTQEFAEHILTHQKSNVIHINELGDFLDGYDGETVRRGHKLPQNMNTTQAFDAAFKAKILIANLIAPYFDQVIFHNCCNDNHAGAFGYCLNSAVKNYLEMRHSNVTVNNYKSFISHYVVGDCLFLITHGKDDKTLKFGFKPNLDPRQEKKITNYLNYFRLLNKGYRVFFLKGDSHQYLFDLSTSDMFDYLNFMAFSPSSEWVQNNFQKGISGAITFNFKNNGQKSINELFF